jgi:hypothetical protein
MATVDGVPFSATLVGIGVLALARHARCCGRGPGSAQLATMLTFAAQPSPTVIETW